jgi:hypothetical protein
MSPVRPSDLRPPLWPWGGPRSVRDRLVEPSDFAQRLQLPKPDPRSPRLPSPALLAFSAPPPTTDSLRLTDPPASSDPGSSDWMLLESLLARSERTGLDPSPWLPGAPTPEQAGVLDRRLEEEHGMLSVLRGLVHDVRWVRERVTEAQKAETS